MELDIKINSDLLCKILLVIVVISILIQIFNFFKPKERFENIPLQEIKYVPNAGDMQFFVRNNRYLDGVNAKNENKSVETPFSSSQYQYDQPTEKCLNNSPAWDVTYNSGSNNTYGDLLWHKMEPRMILQDNCLNCHNFKQDMKYNPPGGVASDLTGLYDDSMENGSLKESKILYDEFLAPELSTGHRYISGELRATGIGPMECDCMSKNVLDSKYTCRKDT
jgi:hypothetical protein